MFEPKLSLLFFVFPYLFLCQGQDNSEYRVRTVAFYNAENLFDTVNDSLTFDDDRTPEGKDRWTPERLSRKIGHIAEVLSQIGAATTGTAPDLVGLCEVENRYVLELLVRDPSLRQYEYGIVHFDSPDERGIDVALLYRKSRFTPIAFVRRPLILENESGERDYTRDQLVVSGILGDEIIHVIVNHWPSRSGGEMRSRPNRIKAAELMRSIMDSIRNTNPMAKILAMGDLNDDPTSISLKKVLRTRADRIATASTDLYNPMEALYREGLGTLAYRDQWNLFDQILVSGTFLDPGADGYRFWKAGIFHPSYLVTSRGAYKGYPLRTYAGGNYVGGYSDHFPVFAFLIKKME